MIVQAELQKPVSIRHAESPPDAALVAAVVSATTNEDYASSGVTFEPFQLLCISGTFDNTWNSEGGDTSITFFQSNGKGGDYLPLGDIALIGSSLDPMSNPTAPGAHILFAPDGDLAVLAHPVGFTKILDDSGSGNSRDMTYLAMIPPEGYTALGIVFNNTNPSCYWCVRNDLVRSVAFTSSWSDAGQGWRNRDGSLLAPVLTTNIETPPEPYMNFVPPTFLSVEGGNPAYAIVMNRRTCRLRRSTR